MPSALAAILDYYKVFSTLDVSAIVSYFCEPSMTIAPQAMFAAANRSALADSLAPLIHSLKAKGYGRSEYVQAEVTALGETAARYGALPYGMRRRDPNWNGSRSPISCAGPTSAGRSQCLSRR